MTSRTYAVRSIAIAGDLVMDAEHARLQIVEPPDLPDFVLTFSTPDGHNLPNDQVALKIVVDDGRTFTANGVDSMPNPWTHRYVNGRGAPGWAKR